MKKIETIDDYISDFPENIQLLLQQMRSTVKAVVPDAVEKISYGIPTFYLNGNLVHFGAFKDHLSFFPTSSGIDAFKDELKDYKVSKGTIQLPIDKPLPLDLITEIVKFRRQENIKK